MFFLVCVLFRAFGFIGFSIYRVCSIFKDMNPPPPPNSAYGGRGVGVNTHCLPYSVSQDPFY